MVANVSYSVEGSEQEQCQCIDNQNYNYRPNNLPTHYHPGYGIMRTSLMPIKECFTTSSEFSSTNAREEAIVGRLFKCFYYGV
ncbi:hypothetical protein TIFTF001_016381 [Ficus carica]|uniref:Uncharacterized protein n=1 Tax=Ficus carica TaxID=3494 RepID=A0AA88ATA3_FICCA|nr:hypothetical protein TIFTF001_016381 [Ficus carica]